MREQWKIQTVPFLYSMITCNYQWKEKTDDFLLEYKRERGGAIWKIISRK